MSILSQNPIILKGSSSIVENSEIISLKQIESPSIGNHHKQQEQDQDIDIDKDNVKLEQRKSKTYKDEDSELIKPNAKKKPLLNKIGLLQPTILLEKYTGIFRSWTLLFQILFSYCILMLIFVSVLIVAKIYQVNSLLEEQSKKNYYTSIVREKLDVQRKVKKELDKINIMNYALSLQRPVLFLRIYTQELISNKVLNCDGGKCPFTNTNLESIKTDQYSNMGNGFTLSSKMNSLMKYDLTSSPSTSKYNFNNLIQFYYHIVPAMYLSLKDQDIPLVNFNFIGNSDDATQSNTDKMYFKYPLESDSISSWSHPTNDKISNFIIDPISSFNISSLKLSKDSKLTFELKEKVKKNNWYYNFEDEMIKNDLDRSNRLISLYQIYPDNKRNEYYINHYACKREFEPGKKYFLHFSMLINKKEMNHSFILNTPNGNVKNFEYISIITSDTANRRVSRDLNDKIYEWDYNIDDDNPFVSFAPKFVKELFKYAMTPSDLVSPDIPEITNKNPFAEIFQYSKIQVIYSKYSINYFFQEDILFFQLLLFLNNYFVYSQRNPPPSDPADTNLYPNISESNRPCIEMDIEHYYDVVSRKKNCIEDFCFYNECNSSNPFYFDMENIEYIPDCYCLPLYCKDSLSPESKISMHKKIESEMGSDYDYSFNNPRKPSNEYVNYTSYELKCRLTFYQKNSTKASSFDTQSFIAPIASTTNYTLFVLYLCNNYQIAQNIVATFESYIQNIAWVILIVYFVLLIGTVIGSTIFMMINVQRLTKRMTEIKKSISEIIRSPDKDATAASRDKDQSSNHMEYDNGNDNGNGFEGNAINNSGDEEHIQLSDSFDKEKSNEQNKGGNVNVNDNGKEDKNKIKTNKKETEDELDQLKRVIFDNQKEFKIDFDIHENVNEKIKGLRKSYKELLNVVKYKKSLFPKRLSIMMANRDQDNSLGMNINNMNNNINLNTEDALKLKEEKERKTEEMSLNVLYELFSLSNEEILDLSKLKHNIYYREKNQKSLLNLSEAINQLEDDKRSYDNEMASADKFKNAMKYYYDNIHQHWKDLHEKKIKEEDL